MTQSASALLMRYPVPCPTCGVTAGQPCVSVTGKPQSTLHSARHVLRNLALEATP